MWQTMVICRIINFYNLVFGIRAMNINLLSLSKYYKNVDEFIIATEIVPPSHGSSFAISPSFEDVTIIVLP